MDNIYGGNGVGLFGQEYGVNTGNAVVIDRLYYSFPVGDEFTVVGGPRSVWTTCCRCGPAPIRLT